MLWAKQHGTKQKEYVASSPLWFKGLTDTTESIFKGVIFYTFSPNTVVWN